MNLKLGLLVSLLWATLQLHAETPTSFEEIKAKAEAGDIDAQKHLATMYAEGIGVETNFVEAAKWDLKAADNGDAKSQFNLGFRFDKGLGVRQDYADAVKWYLKAAEQGYPAAQA